MSPDLRLRSRQFSTFLGGSRADVPPMCPFQLQDRRRGLGRDDVEVVVADKARLAILDTIDGPGGVQLDGRWFSVGMLPN